MTENQPGHIGIILDGNRRFAKKLLLEPWRGHELGAGKIEKLFSWCSELGIMEITLYCFSLENFDRPEKEKNFLMNLFKREFKKYLNEEKIMDRGIKVRVIGEMGRFDSELQELMKKVEKKTAGNSEFIFNFCMAYGGRQEIIDAVKKMVESNLPISEENLKKNLWISGEPELIIRTGGEKRTSNFLMWQSAYSEWVFLDKTWPEFEREDLIECVDEFKKRERRFGR
ncbi:MAG: di-trans,poly-cis-decaprenylcistransferase [Nanoarchaeota archaeon]|nr:di-trans,poly-cis-decaprenylcistransferase [Nanoarchaeota archaeon]